MTYIDPIGSGVEPLDLGGVEPFKAKINEKIEEIGYKKTKLSSIAAKILMPSIYFRKIGKSEKEELAAFIKDDPKNRKHLFLESSDGVNLESLIIKQREFDEKPQEQKWIIAFNPNGCLFQDRLNSLFHYSEGVGANILTINHRQTGNSTGTLREPRDLAIDGDTAVQYLKSLGVVPGNICLYGHSMGGAVAALTAFIQPIDEDIGGIVSDRSFGNLGDVAKTFAGSIGKKAVKKAAWNLDITTLWKKLKKTRKVIIVNKKDEIVKYNKSLYSSLKKIEFSSKKQRVIHLHKKLFSVKFINGSAEIITEGKLKRIKAKNKKSIKKAEQLSAHDVGHLAYLPRFNKLVIETKWALKINGL